MLRRLFALLLLASVMSVLHAQITVGSTPERYYTSLSAMVAGDSVEMPYLVPDQNSNTGLYRFKSDNKALRKTLKKEARVVVHADSLFLNLRKLSYQGFTFDTGYVQTWLLNDSTMMFFAPDNGWKAMGKTFGVALLSAGLTMGMTGGMLAVYPISLGDWSCFIYQNDNHKVQRVNRDLATELLKNGNNALLYFDYKALSDHQQKQQENIKLFLYRMAHE